MLRSYTLLVLMCLSGAFTQKHLISGYVYDLETQQALSDVNITLVGKSAGTITNDQGYFEIMVETLPALLYFSHIGYAIDQVLVSKASQRKIEIYLSPEVTQIDEVTISAEVIQKVHLGDTLNVIDYAVDGDRMILVASPFRKQTDQRLYLTDLQGHHIANLPVKNMGKQIKIPEHLTPEHVYLFEDFMGSFHVLTRQNVQQIDLSGDSIKISYTTSYPNFLKYIFPIKLMFGESLFFQKSSKMVNSTLRTGPDAYRPQFVKTVKDPYGDQRYVEPPRTQLKTVSKNVSAPIISLNDEVLIFDFFDDHIEFFDSIGQTKRIIPIEFHSIPRTYFWLIKTRELNQKEFKQIILKDESTNKIYALFHHVGHRAILKEINPDNGNIINEIEIPDLPNIDKIRVDGNVVYFIYQVKSYPYYTNLYRMKI